jgi:hypothetical protein
MASVVLKGDTSGQVTIAAPAVAGTTTLTLPATTGTVLNDATVGVCRAWVNFNGTGTVAIRASFNVSSITDNGTGNYTVNFTTTMIDENYSACVTIQRENSSANYANVYGSYAADTWTTSAFQIRSTFLNDTASGYADSPRISVSVFR